MAASVNISLKGLVSLVKDLPKLTMTLEKQIAKAAPSEIVKNIKKGLTGIDPSGGLDDNEDSTLTRKRALGHGGRPLIDYKKLTNASNWRTEKSTDGYLIKVPKDREVAAYHLHNGVRGGKTYNFMKTPKGFFPDFAAKLKTNFFNKTIKNYR